MRLASRRRAPETPGERGGQALTRYGPASRGSSQATVRGTDCSADGLQEGTTQVVGETASMLLGQRDIWPEVTSGPCCGQGLILSNSATCALDNGGKALTTRPARGCAARSQPQAVPWLHQPN